MQILTPTKTDRAADEWAINDTVTQLRPWGTATIRSLPEPPIDEVTVGSDATCTIRIDDPWSLVSHKHACLVRDQGRWLLRDLGSKNGVQVDGARRRQTVLRPGIEIGIGGVTLIAESDRLIAFRGFLARLLGYGSDRTEVVDHALRSVRKAATRRTALVLCGDGDLVPLAHSIHRHSRGAEQPFVVSDPRRQTGKATVRSAESHSTGMDAVAAATGGSLCVRTRRLPPDFHAVVQELRSPHSQVQLIVCAEAPEDCELYGVAPIVIPPLAARAAELDRIISEYVQDARAELGAPHVVFPEVDREWVYEHAITSLHDIEKATLRLVALRASRNLSDAAHRLGMAPVSLSRWMGRRDDA